MENLISAITSSLIQVINDTFGVLGKGLGVAFFICILTWYGVENFTPATWPRRTNALAALLIGMVLTLSVHLTHVMSYGDAGAAVVYGLLGGLAAVPFHDLIAKRFLKPFLASKE